MAFAQLTGRESLRDTVTCLRAKVFFGHAANAVKTQIWIAVCVDVLVAILAKERAVSRNPANPLVTGQ